MEWLCMIDWVAVSAVATLVMAFTTFITIRQNQKQLNEMKRQWKEEHRPILCFNVMVYDQAYFLQIANIGNKDADNICISFNDEFISNLKPKIQQYFIALNNSSFFVERNNKRYLYIGWCEEVNEEWKDKDFSIIITGKYGSVYTVNHIISIKEFVGKGFFIVNTETDRLLNYIKKGLVMQNDQYYPIQKSLDIIAKSINNKQSMK